MNDILSDKLIKKFIPSRKINSRKGDNGVVLVIGGSYIYHGAPLLSSLAAIKAGADLVYTAVPKIIVDPIRSYSPNLIVIPLMDPKLTRGTVNKLLGSIPTNIDSVTIGMGSKIEDKIPLKILIDKLLDRGIRLSLDASALVADILPLLPNNNAVVTPHSGEFKRLFGLIPPLHLPDRISIVEKLADQNSVVILLKGYTDIISNGVVTYINPKKTPSMTVGGTGDILSGLVATMLAKSTNPIEAASVAVYINGRSGKLAQEKYGCHIVATDLIEMLPYIMKQYDVIN